MVSREYPTEQASVRLRLQWRIGVSSEL